MTWYSMRTNAILALLALAILFAAPATAQPDQADVLFRKGNELFKKKDFAGARDAFEQAFKLRRAYDIATNLAYAEMHVKQHVAAAEHLAFALRNWPPTGKDDNRKVAVKRFDAEKAEVVTLTVRVNASGAAVFVGNRQVGTAPLEDPAFAEPGTITVKASLTGYEDATKTIDAAKGTEQTITLDLKATVPPPVATVPTADPTAVPSSSGTVVPPQTTSAPVAHHGPPTALIVGTGIGAAVGAGIGIGFMLAANHKASVAADADRQVGNRSCAGASPVQGCSDLESALKSQGTLSNGAVVGFVAGGALLVATGGLLVWSAAASPKSDEKSTAGRVTVRIGPVVTGREQGAVVLGRF